jgi:predicted nucleic acid-binding Zn ribbon protein
MKKRDPQLVSDIIQAAINQSGTRQAYDQQHICYLWPEIVGPSINRYTTRRWVERDELHVCIASASLKNELSFLTSSLVQRLNAAAGANVITKIIFH